MPHGISFVSGAPGWSIMVGLEHAIRCFDSQATPNRHPGLCVATTASAHSPSSRARNLAWRNRGCYQMMHGLVIATIQPAYEGAPPPFLFHRAPRTSEIYCFTPVLRIYTDFSTLFEAPSFINWPWTLPFGLPIFPAKSRIINRLTPWCKNLLIVIV